MTDIVVTETNEVIADGDTEYVAVPRPAEVITIEGETVVIEQSPEIVTIPGDVIVVPDVEVILVGGSPSTGDGGDCDGCLMPGDIDLTPYLTIAAAAATYLTPAAGDTLFLTQAEADFRYLKLDSSNDPVTGTDLNIEADLYVDGYTQIVGPLDVGSFAGLPVIAYLVQAGEFFTETDPGFIAGLSFLVINDGGGPSDSSLVGIQGAVGTFGSGTQSGGLVGGYFQVRPSAVGDHNIVWGLSAAILSTAQLGANTIDVSSVIHFLAATGDETVNTGGLHASTWTGFEGVNLFAGSTLTVPDYVVSFHAPNNTGHATVHEGIFCEDIARFTHEVRIQSTMFVPAQAQAAEPTLANLQLQIWRDTDDNSVWLIYRDATAGQKKVQLV